jgi:hypothetical protein
MLDNAGDYPVETSEKQEDESSGDTSAEVSLNFNPSHAPTMQDNFVVPAKELVTLMVWVNMCILLFQFFLSLLPQITR